MFGGTADIAVAAPPGRDVWIGGCRYSPTAGEPLYVSGSNWAIFVELPRAPTVEYFCGFVYTTGGPYVCGFRSGGVDSI